MKGRKMSNDNDKNLSFGNNVLCLARFDADSMIATLSNSQTKKRLEYVKVVKGRLFAPLISISLDLLP